MITAGIVVVAGAAVAAVHFSGGNDLVLPAAAPTASAAPTTFAGTAPAPTEVHAFVYLCSTKDQCTDGDATEAERDAVRAVLVSAPGVTGVAFVDHDEAYRRLRKALADRPDLLDGLSPEDMAESFQFTVDADGYAGLAQRLRALPGVDQVQRQPQRAGRPATPSPFHT